MTQQVEDFVQVRSFLAGNVETMLENLVARRESSKIDSEDLFAADQPAAQAKIPWQKNYPILKRLDMLLAEKESLGLYVSGNPLAEYQELLKWVREAAGQDDIYLIIIEKVRKIFTKAGTMMFALQVSMAGQEVEGIVFPKNAMRHSGKLEEKEMFWVKGNITERSKGKKKNGNSEEEEPNDDSVQEFVELPKLAIEEINTFDQGILPLFEGEEIKLAANRIAILENVDWTKLKENPHANPQLLEKSSTVETVAPSEPSTNKTYTEAATFQLPNTLGKDKLIAFKKLLKNSPNANTKPVKLEIQDSAGNWQKVKGDFWIDENAANQVLQS